MNKLNLKASPGIAIVEQIKGNQSQFANTSQQPGRIIAGKILSMGEYDTTSSGEKVMPERYGKVGDIIHFMSYYTEGGADIGTVDNKQFYFVKWAEFRAVEI